MRKITEESVRAFENDFTFKESNTEVKVTSDHTTLYLFGNAIARKIRATGTVSITMAGWETPTTKERLKGLDGVRIITRSGVTYLNGKKWDGEWIFLEEEKPKEDNALGIMKGFLVLGNLTSDNASTAEKVAYKEKIVFSTMKSKIPDWNPPSDWNSISDEVKLERLTKIEAL